MPSKEQRAELQKQGVTLFLGLSSWAKAGYPSKSVIYDLAGALVDHRVPLVDSVFSFGIYKRSGSIAPLQEMTNPILYLDTPSPMPHTSGGKPTVIKNQVVMVDPKVTAKASGHGKMSRGVGHRSKKAAKGKDVKNEA